jgi:hypothetical protein
VKGYRFYGESSKLNEKIIHKGYEVDLVMPMERQAQSAHEFSVYVGPLDYKKVKSLGVSLEKIMNLGWKIIQHLGSLDVYFSAQVYPQLRRGHRCFFHFGENYLASADQEELSIDERDARDSTADDYDTRKICE